MTDEQDVDEETYERYCLGEISRDRLIKIYLTRSLTHDLGEYIHTLERDTHDKPRNDASDTNGRGQR
jgi:hypothetical protein